LTDEGTQRLYSELVMLVARSSRQKETGTAA